MYASSKLGLSYQNWAAGEPNNGGSNDEECVQCRWNGLWNDVSCDFQSAFACERSKCYMLQFVCFIRTHFLSFQLDIFNQQKKSRR